MKKNAAVFSSFTALFTAVICVSCLIKIPLGVIPIVLQNIMCILCALLIGGAAGALPTLLFLLVGLIGFPVYSGGTGGIAVWLGPTGGFLPGYLIGAFAAGLISGKPDIEEKKLCAGLIFRMSIAVITGLILIYIPGVIGFMLWSKTPFVKTMAVCVLPFIPGDVIKALIAVPVAVKLRPVAAQYLYGGE